MKNTQKGFTLLEVLLVVAILGILAGIVILALNPSKQLADSRNSQRKADVTTILNAVYQYAIDNSTIPSTITTTPTAICKTGGTCTGLINLQDLTNNGVYIVSMPFDPQGATANSTGYTISKDANNRVTVSAPSAENGVNIGVTR